MQSHIQTLQQNLNDAYLSVKGCAFGNIGQWGVTKGNWARGEDAAGPKLWKRYSCLTPIHFILAHHVFCRFLFLNCNHFEQNSEAYLVSPRSEIGKQKENCIRTVRRHNTAPMNRPTQQKMPWNIQTSWNERQKLHRKLHTPAQKASTFSPLFPFILYLKQQAKWWAWIGNLTTKRHCAKKQQNNWNGN